MKSGVNTIGSGGTVNDMLRKINSGRGEVECRTMNRAEYAMWRLSGGFAAKRLHAYANALHSLPTNGPSQRTEPPY